jgi:FtsP/CotA-like multicopper oxidase with cupredoxin domain
MLRKLSPLLMLACSPIAPEGLPVVWGVTAAVDFNPAPEIVEVHLTAAKTSQSWGDASTKAVWAFNEQVPGPLIQAELGQEIQIVFTNDLREATTIHWHGLRISDDMDGVPAIQTPIEPGETFTYRFTPPDAGTFWYHPHVRSNEQIERGLYGTLIVHEPDAVVVARERMFVLDDVALDEDGAFADFEIGHMASVHGRLGNRLLANGVNILDEPLADSVLPGVPERWRVVNTANARTMWLDVRGADWRVIAVDGTLLEEPFEAEMLLLPIGRRFDLEVIPRVDAKAAKLRILLPGEVGFDSYTAFSGNIEGEAGDGGWSSWNGPSLGVVPKAEQTVSIELDGFAEGPITRWTINGDLWPDHAPIEVRGNVASEIVVTELSGAEHPFHLHGQFFRVVSRTGPEVGPPGLLDTVLVHPDEELVLSTSFDNPGRWMAHCHILEHAELGMMTQMIVTP